MNAVECIHLSKIFSGKNVHCEALSDLTFLVPPGKIVGILGPDGSGKTTLLRILTGLLTPTAGSVRVLGMDVTREAKKIQSLLGYLPQKFGLYENLSVMENLILYAELHDVPANEQKKRFDQLLEMTDLSGFRTRMAGALSGGMKQKLALGCALVSTPPLLILDEATVGVDVLSRRELWGILRTLTKDGRMSVIASTAYMDEADYCDETLILFNGRSIAQETPAGICRLVADKVATPRFEEAFQILLTGRLLPPLCRKRPVSDAAPVMVHAEDMTKKFGSFIAVDHVSFDVRKGEIFGLLGANGAGKTTTFRMLCGLSGNNGGTIEIGGFNLRTAPGAARAKLGFVAQKFSLYSDLSCFENLRFFGSAYGLLGAKLKERLAWGIENFQLEKYRDSPAGKLPLGYKQRLSMACALLHEPEILFLDEATSGADPVARHEFWARIMALADSGVAVIITTHFLDEAAYCDRMVIMQSGISVAAGSGAEIQEQGREPGKEIPSLEDAFVNIIRKFRQEHGAS